MNLKKVVLFSKIANMLIDIQVYSLILAGIVFLLLLVMLPLLIIGFLPVSITFLIKWMFTLKVLCLVVIASAGLIKRLLRKKINE